jgi:virginiamycin B lyase
MASRRVLPAVFALIAAFAGVLAPTPAEAIPGDVTPVISGLVGLVDAVRLDGAVWVIAADGTLGRLTGTDVVETIPLDEIISANGMTAGPDGNLWIAIFQGDHVARVDPDTHVVTVFPTTGIDGPLGVVTGPDGGVWLTGFLNNVLGRIDPATGVVTTTTGSGLVGPEHITAGSDGNLWYTGNGQVGRLTMSNGNRQTFNPTGVSGLRDIASAADGTLWITGNTNDTIGKVDLGTGATTPFPATGVDGPATFGVTNGELWVSGQNNDTVAKITTSTGAVAAHAVTGVDEPGAITQLNGTQFAVLGSGLAPVIGVVTQSSGALVETGPSSSIDLPQGVVLGPDGNIWMDAFADDRVVRFDRVTGEVTPFALPGLDGPHEIAVGPDGNLWTTGRTNDTIGRVDPDTGAASVFPTTGVDNPRGITAGPDGNVWIVGRDNDTVGRVNPTSGVVTPFPATGVDAPRQITAAPDGNLYLTGSANDTIARVTPATGAVTPISTGEIDGPFGIATGADGRLWVTGTSVGDISRVALDGTVEHTEPLPTGASPINVLAGPDGNLWVAAQGIDELIRVTPFFGITRFSTAGATDGPIDMAAAPDNQLWFGGELDDRVATMRTFAPHGFSDVAASAFFQDGLEWARSFGLVEGFANGTYRPRNAVLRGQIVNMLWNLMDQPAGSPPHGFADVRPTAFFDAALDWAKAEGLVSGFARNRYRPNDAVNRGQLVNMLWNLVGQPEGSPPHGFGDVRANAFFGPALDWAKAQGLVSGFGGNRYKPNDPVNRGQVVSILYNLARNPAAWEGADTVPPTVLFTAG